MSRNDKSGTFAKVPPLDVGEDDELPDLTAQQMHFVEGILAGQTASDAYRAAYDVSNMADRTIWAEASRLRANRNVATWLRAARMAHLGNAVRTKESHVLELERLKELALQAGDVKAAMAGEHLIGKASGLYVERTEINIHDPAAILEQIRQMDPHIAERLAARFGLSLALPKPTSNVIDTTAEPLDATVLE